MIFRTVKQQFQSESVQDGAGVQLKRIISQLHQHEADPYLMMDMFHSDDPQDYIEGFPNHPHRGFETITYIIEGHMLHEDHLGHRGDLAQGGVQHMIAGRGIIHSEMPQQTEGQMHGFQIWLNLPRKNKMQPASYQNYTKEQLTQIYLPEIGHVTLIAGELTFNYQSYRGPISAEITQPILADIQLNAESELILPLPPGDNALLYVFHGDINIDEDNLPYDTVATLTAGDTLHLKAGAIGGRMMLLAGKPLNEPIVQHGPFVMNSAEEIKQAIDDYNSGIFPD